MTNWVNTNKRSIIRTAFLVPILAVAIISISHVVSWYDLANPISWAVYLSIAVEIAAMSAIAASSVKVKGFSVWFVFIIVTLIQFIGNIFFCFSEIDISSQQFKDWVDLTTPILDMMGSDITDSISQRRWLALLEGGLLPLISLTCLHFFIQYGNIDDETPSVPVIEEPKPAIDPIPEAIVIVDEPAEPIQDSPEDLVEPETEPIIEISSLEQSGEEAPYVESDEKEIPSTQAKGLFKKKEVISDHSRHKKNIRNLMKLGKY